MDVIIALGSVVAALLTIWKVILPAIRWGRRRAERRERMYDVVLGTEAIPDLDRPGQYLRPAVPDMGVRMAAVEGAVTGFIAQEAAAARHAAERAAADARAALAGVAHLRAAAQVWHGNEIEVLTNIEKVVAEGQDENRP